jgi:drug/metabolite transporter (DMT)-like permease
MRLRADLTLFLVAALWGSAFVAQRLAGQEGSVFLFNGARFLLGALILLPFACTNTFGTGALRRGMLSHPQLLWMAAAGTILFVASALQQAGLQSTTAGNAGFITSLYVVLVPLILLMGWHERTHWVAWLAVLMAGLGAFFLSTAGRLEFRAGDTLELFGALFWALHMVVLGKFAVRFNPLSFSLGQFIFGGALNLLVGAAFEHPAVSGAGVLIGAVVYTAIFSVGIGYTLQVWAQRHAPPTDAALILSLEAVFAVFFGWLVLDERLLPLQLIGCGLILSGVLLAQARVRRRI